MEIKQKLYSVVLTLGISLLQLYFVYMFQVSQSTILKVLPKVLN